MTSLIGTQLGRYEILAEIGRGSMGVVYRARDPKIDREVAIKTISLAGQDAPEEREYRERFFHEAKAAGRLSHPGIVTIYDVGEQPETHEPYIVMECVAGESLNNILNSGDRKLPLISALQLCRELAESLHYAHSQGVIHRDIKPANILVTPGCHAKIADFGVAKLNLSGLTLPGQILGSPAFMAPEQLSGEEVDARADLFALGVILYNMVTGHRPFQGNSTNTVCFKLLNRDPIPVTALNSELPPKMDEIVARAMAKDPADRFQSGAEMASTIASFLEENTPAEEKPIAVAAREAMGRSRAGAEVPPTIATPRTGAPVGTSKPLARPAPQTNSKIQTNSKARGLRFGSDQAYIAVAAVVLLAAGAVAIYRGSRSTSASPAVQARQAVVPETTAPPPEVEKALDSPITVQSATVETRPAAPTKPEPKIRAARSRRVEVAPAKKLTNASVASLNLAAAHSSPNPAPLAVSAPIAPTNSTPKANTAVNVPAPQPISLMVEFEYPFTEADATLWVDDKLVLKQALHGEEKKHALLFKRIEGRESKSIQVPLGQHTVHVRVHAADNSYDQSESLTGMFDATQHTVLNVVCDKRGHQLKLDLRDPAAANRDETDNQ